MIRRKKRRGEERELVGVSVSIEAEPTPVSEPVEIQVAKGETIREEVLAPQNTQIAEAQEIRVETQQAGKTNPRGEIGPGLGESKGEIFEEAVSSEVSEAAEVDAIGVEEAVLEEIRADQFAEIDFVHPIRTPEGDFTLFSEDVGVAEVVETYGVSPPFGRAQIVRDTKGKFHYNIMEPAITREEREILENIKAILMEESTLPLERLRDKPFMEEFLKKEMDKVIKNHGIELAEAKVDPFLYYLRRDFLGYGKIDVIMSDPRVEDVSCDGIDVPIYVWHTFYENVPTNLIMDKEELDALILRLAYKTGYQVTVSNPLLDGDLPEGSRTHIALGEISKRGGSFTIRKFTEKPFTIVDLIRLKTLSPEIAAYFWMLSENLRSIMIIGATAAGKTTVLNAIATFIYPEAKIVTIEETRELRLPHENWVPMVTRQVFHDGIREITLFDLLKSAMRQRPDYIIVGEIRGEEAYTLFQAISTGHGGLCTIHSDSLETSVKRLLTKPMDVPLMLIPLMSCGANIGRVKIGGKITRRIFDVKEIAGVDEETGNVFYNTVYTWRGEGEDTYNFSGRSTVFEKLAQIKYIPVQNLYEELDTRARLLKWMADVKEMSYAGIAETIRTFYHDRQKLLDRIAQEEG